MIAEQIEPITGDEVKYSKDILKVKFKTNDDLPFGEVINIPVCVIVISNIFQENNKYYPQMLLMLLLLLMLNVIIILLL